MIIAALDYLKYKYSLGRYSHKNLVKNDWSLATKENFPTFNDLPALSVLIVHTKESFLSWLVMYFTDSVASHVAGFLGKGELMDLTTSGMVIHLADDYLDGKSYLCVRVINEEIRAKNPNAESGIRNFAEEHKDVQYSWTKAINLGLVNVFAERKDAFRFRYLIDFLILYSIPGIILYLIWWPFALPFALISVLHTWRTFVNLIKAPNKNNTEDDSQ